MQATKVWGTAAANCECPKSYILVDHSLNTLSQASFFANAAGRLSACWTQVMEVCDVR